MLKHTIQASLLCLVFLLNACGMADQTASGIGSAAPDDTLPPVVNMMCRTVDTVYLGEAYQDPGARVEDNMDDFGQGPMQIETHYLLNDTGIHVLHYGARDRAGNLATVRSRTLHVVNSAAFLTGEYAVSCTCSAVNPQNQSSVVTSQTYPSLVLASGSRNGKFDISTLKVPAEVTAFGMQNRTDMTVSFFGKDVVQAAGATGSISGTKDSFTLHTTSHSAQQPSLTFTCLNVFVKQTRSAQFGEVH